LTDSVRIELDGVQREQLINQWAARLERWGLAPAVPALFQVLRPFGFLGSQVLLFGQPVLSLFAQDQAIQRLSALLDDENALEQIERRLEMPHESETDKSKWR
jgi:hypothetical protein